VLETSWLGATYAPQQTSFWRRRFVYERADFVKGNFMTNRIVSTIALSAVVASAALLNSQRAYAAVSVTFTKSDQYIDMPFSHSDREDTLKKLREHFERLGSKLPNGQDFKVEVLDVDLAGRLEPSRMSSSQELRVLRGGADWPMIQLRYSIEADGKTVKQGEARLTDLNYLRHMNRYPTGEPLRYEKAMLDDWFNKEILPSKP
jgi:hypothetical protein